MSQSIVPSIERQAALDVANLIKDDISKFCDEFIICGGLRRGKDLVHDVDIVTRPNDYFSISTVLSKYSKFNATPSKYFITVNEIPVELFVCDSEEQFEVLKLVRTGSNTFNKILALQAHDHNMVLRFQREKKLFGLYGAIEYFDSETRDKKWVINPLRHVAYKENDIIMTVFNNQSYLDPKNRNMGFEQVYGDDL